MTRETSAASHAYAPLLESLSAILPDVASALATSPGIHLVILERDGVIVWANEAAGKAVARSAVELVGRTLAGMLTAADADHFAGYLRNERGPPRDRFLLNVAEGTANPQTLTCRLFAVGNRFLLLAEPLVDANRILQDELIQVNNQLTVLSRENARNHRLVQKLNDHLSARIAQRTQELEEACSKLKDLEDGGQEYLRVAFQELRTPAHGVLGIGQLAIDEIADDNLRNEYQSHFTFSSQRLIGAIEAALQLADLQRGGVSITTTPVDLCQVFAHVEPTLQASFEAKTVAFLFRPTKPAIVRGNEELLRQSLTTLLKAALRLASPDTAISARLLEDADRHTLRIDFEGPRMPDDLRHTFFQTFSADRSSSLVEDLGLTLPLAAKVLNALGGNVALLSTETGMEIEVSLLKASTEPAGQ